MAYENIPGHRAEFLDGNLRTPASSAQPRIIILGTASGGFAHELWQVANIKQTEREFGASSELLQGVHEAIAQGADNIAVMRIGGTLGQLVVTKSANTLTLAPQRRDADALGRYSMALITGRLLIYDTVDTEWVYDSDDVLVLDTGVVEVTAVGTVLADLVSTTGTPVLADPTTYIKLNAITTASFTSAATAVASDAGTDGANPTLPVRYAALSQAYHLLDWADGDFVIPMGVYMDDSNLAEGFSYSNGEDLFFDPPEAAGSDSALGYAWEYEYRGRLYTYFTETNSGFFTGIADLTGVQADGAIADAVINVDDIVITARKRGTDGDGILIQADATGVAGPTISVSYSAVGVPTVLITDDGTATWAEIEAAINAHDDASKWVTASAGTGVVLSGDLAATAISALGTLSFTTTTAETAGVGGAYLDPKDLTGTAAPNAVELIFFSDSSAAFTPVDAELRAVNFAHQLASFCRHASTTWKALMGSISFKAPTKYGRSAISDWVGSLPTYTDLGTDLVVSVAGDDGSGILGNKFLAGENGYRNGALTSPADVNDGKAYGGLILTAGASLPNSDRTYGVDDADEALDSGGQPVDLGKHLIVTYDWPIHRNRFDTSAPYRGSIQVSVLAKYCTMPENQEAIGQNGRLRKVVSSPRVHAAQQNRLAKIRAIGLRREENVGLLLVSADTAAHPDSDYTNISTMRSLNRHLNGIFNIVKRFIGQEYTPDKLQAIDQAIGAFLRNERVLGMNNGAVHRLKYTVADRILGRLTVELRVVPPFSLRTITVEASLAADETEL